MTDELSRNKPTKPQTDRYKRKVRKDGSSVYERKKSLIETVTGLTKQQKQDGLHGDPVLVPLPKGFRDASKHTMPLDFECQIIRTDEGLDKAYHRLKGMSGLQVRNLLQQLVERLIEEQREECLVASPEAVLNYLDRQIEAAGVELTGHVTWQQKFRNKHQDVDLEEELQGHNEALEPKAEVAIGSKPSRPQASLTTVDQTPSDDLEIKVEEVDLFDD